MCAPGYFLSGSACLPCPTANIFLQLLLPLVGLVTGLFLLGTLLLLLSITLRDAAAARRSGSRHAPASFAPHCLPSCSGGAVPWAWALGVGLCTSTRRVVLSSDAAMQDSRASALSFVVWAARSMQGVSILMSQAAPISPQELAPIINFFASFQLQGFTLSPSCQSGTKYLIFHTAVAVQGLGMLAALASLLLLATLHAPLPCALCPCARARALPLPSLRAAARSLLSRCLTLLILIYGPVTAQSAALVMCRAPAQLSLNSYVSSDSDGASMAAQLPGAPYTMDTLRAAQADAGLAAYAGAVAFMGNSTLQVSLLATNSYTVCNEGAHAPVLRLAWASLLAFTLLFPAALGAFLWGAAGRLKGFRRVLCGVLWGSGGAASVVRGTRAPLAGTLAGEVMDALTAAMGSAYRSSALWFVLLEMALLASTTLLVSASAAVGTWPAYACIQAAIAVLNLGVVLVLALRVQPFTRLHGWKRLIAALLYALAFLAALVNALTFQDRATAVVSSVAPAGLAYVPLVLAVVLFAALLGSWLWSEYHCISDTAVGKAAPGEGGEGEDSEWAAPRSVLGRHTLVVRGATGAQGELESAEPPLPALSATLSSRALSFVPPPPPLPPPLPPLEAASAAEPAQVAPESCAYELGHECDLPPPLPAAQSLEAQALECMAGGGAADAVAVDLHSPRISPRVLHLTALAQPKAKCEEQNTPPFAAMLRPLAQTRAPPRRSAPLESQQLPDATVAAAVLAARRRSAASPPPVLPSESFY